MKVGGSVKLKSCFIGKLKMMTNAQKLHLDKLFWANCRSVCLLSCTWVELAIVNSEMYLKRQFNGRETISINLSQLEKMLSVNLQSGC